MASESPEEPKLIVDEDWKTQVQREKERLKQQKSKAEFASSSAEDQLEERSAVVEQTVTQSEGTESEPGNNPGIEYSTDPDSADDGQDLQAPPPASFEFLVSGMATQAIAAMGQLPGDDGQPLPVRLDYARHYIDLLGIIESKTAGNLSDAEQRFLQNTLHQLRMLFVSVKK